MSVHMEGRRAEINLSTFLESPSLFFKIGSLIGLRIRLSRLSSVLQRPAHLFILMLRSQACIIRNCFQYISQNMKNRKDFNLLRKFLQCLDLEPQKEDVQTVQKSINFFLKAMTHFLQYIYIMFGVLLVQCFNSHFSSIQLWKHK